MAKAQPASPPATEGNSVPAGSQPPASPPADSAPPAGTPLPGPQLPPINPAELLAQFGSMPGKDAAGILRAYLDHKSANLNSLPPADQGAWRTVIEEARALAGELERQPTVSHAAFDSILKKRVQEAGIRTEKKVDKPTFQRLLTASLPELMQFLKR